MNYGWVITKDELFEPSDEQYGITSKKGVMGPQNIPPTIERRLRDGEGKLFRMLDDDGEVYYYGRLIHPDGEGIEPLDDFGMPDSGCTEIQFRYIYANGGRGWKTL